MKASCKFSNRTICHQIHLRAWALSAKSPVFWHHQMTCAPVNKESIMNVKWVYITAKSMDEARRIGKELVRSRLAACINIIDNINSLYMWEGKIQDDREVVLIAKTTESRMPELIESVKSLHSYSCPCILALPVLDGNQAFLDWIANEVSES